MKIEVKELFKRVLTFFLTEEDPLLAPLITIIHIPQSSFYCIATN